MLAIALLALQAAAPDLRSQLIREYVKPRAVYHVKVKGIRAEGRFDAEPQVYVDGAQVLRITYRGLKGVLRETSSARDVRNALAINLEPGHRVRIIDVEIDKENIRFHIETVQSVASSDGLRAALVYHVRASELPNVTLQDAQKSLAMLLAPEDPPTKPAAAAGASTAAPAVTVERGMTPSQVQQALGAPSRRLAIGAKTIWTYADGIKVTFVDGKVDDIQ
jgi:hypothetical protein